jgi:hypothetical protein
MASIVSTGMTCAGTDTCLRRYVLFLVYYIQVRRHVSCPPFSPFNLYFPFLDAVAVLYSIPCNECGLFISALLRAVERHPRAEKN